MEHESFPAKRSTIVKMTGAKKMGRFAVQLEVANRNDMRKADEGTLEPEKVRRMTIEGIVDNGAVRLVLPAKVVKQLGLAAGRKVRVKYADQHVATRELVQDVYVNLQGRDGIFSAFVEPKRDRALVGAIVLEEMDFLVDPTNERVVPRDPRFVVSEIE